MFSREKNCFYEVQHKHGTDKSTSTVYSSASNYPIIYWEIVVVVVIVHLSLTNILICLLPPLSKSMDVSTSLYDDSVEELLPQRSSLTEQLLQHRSIHLSRNSPNNTSQLAIIGSNLCPIESLDYEYVVLHFSPLIRYFQ
jgi:hypothetical protein